MTLVKLNRAKRTGTNLAPNYQSNIPLISSEGGSVLPGIFDTFARPFFGGELIQDFFDETMNLGSGTIGTTVPAVNISETENDLVIEMAAPGMRKKDFKVEIIGDQLHIIYNKERKHESNGANHWRKEYSFESFERNFTLPTIVDSEKIGASYTDGILKIMVPKKEEARSKPIKAIEIK